MTQNKMDTFDSLSRINLINIFLLIALFVLSIQPSFALTKKQRIAKTHSVQHHTHRHTRAHIQKKKTIVKTAKKQHAQTKKTKSIHKKIHIKKSHIKQHKQHSANAAKLHTNVNVAAITQSQLSQYSLKTNEKNLVTFVQQTVSNMHYSSYKLGGDRIDSSRGIYVVDCSRYVDHVLKNIYPQAYTSLTSWSGTTQPTTNDYYHYFTNLSAKARHWTTIEDVEELRPGDILVFRNINRRGNETGGHVMVVMDKPARDSKTTFSVRIADSAPSGHTQDTRVHTSGIGIGTMFLKVDPSNYQPYAYAWKMGAPWESRVNFAMARPIDVG